MSDSVEPSARRDFLLRALMVPLAMSIPSFAHAQQTPLPRVERRAIASTGEALPVVGCGTWRTFDVGDDVNGQARLAQVLNVLFAAGGSVIDSSPMYGSSEAVAGTLLTRLDAHRKAFVATKVWTQGREAGIAQMEESMRRLQQPRIDLMQVHNLVDWRTQIATLRDWKARGRIRYIGITHYTSSAFDEVASVMRSEKPDFVQINYAADDRDAEARILPLAHDLGIGRDQSAVRRGRAAVARDEAAGARVGRRYRLHDMGADPAEIRARAAGRDRRDSGHGPARIHDRQHSRRCRTVPGQGDVQADRRSHRRLMSHEADEGADAFSNTGSLR
jgi:aryl-alcohol dehydrogenase-like predicted oxidoreductase